MQTKTEHFMGSLGALLDPTGPTVRVTQLTKAELATLAKAADILENLRAGWENEIDEDMHPLGTDVVLAMYTMRELIDDKGRVEL